MIRRTRLFWKGHGIKKGRLSTNVYQEMRGSGNLCIASGVFSILERSQSSANDQGKGNGV